MQLTAVAHAYNLVVPSLEDDLPEKFLDDAAVDMPVSVPVAAPVDVPITGRVLSLDVGSRTIGLAVSDPLGITAQGLFTIRRKGRRYDFDALNDVVRQYEVKQLVVGYPLHMSGDTGTQSNKVAAFAEELREHFHIPVHLWDERLTTAEAQRMLRESEMSVQRRGEVIDKLAAVLILQSWMDARGF